MAWRNVVGAASLSASNVLIPLAISKGLCTWVYLIFSNNVSYSNLVIFYYLGLPVTEEQLHEVAIESGVLNITDDFPTPEFQQKCEQIMPDKESVKLDQCKYAFLKHNFQL